MKRIKHAFYFVFLLFISISIIYSILKYSSLFRPYKDMLVYLYLFTPAIIAMIMRYKVSKERLKGLSLNFSNIKNYIYGWIALFTLFIAVYIIVTISDIGRWNLHATTTPLAWGLAIIIGQNILNAILPGMIIILGEELGWRGYLQGKLIHLGKTRAFLLIGIIWGLWHFPLIWAGYAGIGPGVGYIYMMLTTIMLSFILGLLYMKTKDIWLVCFLHAAYNSMVIMFAKQVLVNGLSRYIPLIILAGLLLVYNIFNDISDSKKTKKKIF